MANIFTVRDIEDADDGDVVKGFKGEITRFFGKYSSGTNDKGEWSFQHMLVKDADGDEIKLTLKKLPPLPTNKKGAEIELRAHHGKNDWTGLYAKDDEYNGETKRILQATSTCEILVDGEALEAGRERSSGRDRDDKRSGDRRERDNDRGDRERSSDRDERKRDREPERERETARDRRNSSEDVEQATDIGMKLKNVMDMALDLAYTTMGDFEKRSDVTVSPEMILNNAHTFFIQMSKERVQDMVPTEPMREPEPEPEPDDKPKGKGK